MKYALLDKRIIHVDDDMIVQHITNLDDTKQYKRIGSGKRTYICGHKIPQQYGMTFLYDSKDILLKANNLITDITDGLFISYYKYGQKKEEYYLVNNKIQGTYTEFYQNGDIKKTCNYIDGIKHGESISYSEEYLSGSNGNRLPQKIVEHCFYNNGVLDGVYKGHIDNKYVEITYKNGIKNGYFEEHITIDNDHINYDPKYIYTKGYYINNIMTEAITYNTKKQIVGKKYIDPTDKNNLISEIYFVDGKLKILEIYNNNTSIHREEYDEHSILIKYYDHKYFIIFTNGSINIPSFYPEERIKELNIFTDKLSQSLKK
jgi:hypothetical protein